MAIEIKVNDREARIRLSGLKRTLARSSIHRIVGNVMRASINDTFDQQGFPPGAWRRVYASTIAAQFTRGGARSRRLETKGGRQTKGFQRFAAGKKLLTDSGRLRNSITFRSRGGRVEIGTNLIYARVQQEGAVIRAKHAKALRIPIGGGRAIFRKQVVIPARPFLLIKPQDPNVIVEAIERAAGESRRTSAG